MSKNVFRHRPVTVTALSIAGTRTVLKIRKQQYICKLSASCPKTITKVAEIKGISRGCRIVDNVKQRIIMDLHRNISQKELVQDYYVSASTVGRTIDTLEDNFIPVRDWLPSTIAFDDFKSGEFTSSGRSMLLMNPTNHRIIDIIGSRNSRYIRQYFYHHFKRQARWRVRLVVVDHRALIKELLHYRRSFSRCRPSLSGSTIYPDKNHELLWAWYA